jgi:hypothetical protein
MKFFMIPETLSLYSGVAKTTTSADRNCAINSPISSDWTHLPGLLSQQVKHPRQCPIFFPARKIFAVSAPASLAPARNGSTMRWVLLCSARGLPLKATIFIGPPINSLMDSKGNIDIRI